MQVFICTVMYKSIVIQDIWYDLQFGKSIRIPENNKRTSGKDDFSGENVTNKDWFRIYTFYSKFTSLLMKLKPMPLFDHI